MQTQSLLILIMCEKSYSKDDKIPIYATVPAHTTVALSGLWVAPADLQKYGMPTLMQKVTKALGIL